jgi:hypothetical protein
MTVFDDQVDGYNGRTVFEWDGRRVILINHGGVRSVELESAGLRQPFSAITWIAWHDNTPIATSGEPLTFGDQVDFVVRYWAETAERAEASDPRLVKDELSGLQGDWAEAVLGWRPE